MTGIKKFTNILQEFSLPLIVGVIAALVVANMDHHLYETLVEYEVFGHGASILGHHVTAHFLINDIFMVFFFGIAAKEITEAALPGGDLNPPSKAINPLLGTLGGVAGPVAVYFLMTGLLYSGDEYTAVINGWGIPTATDIALAWLIARLVFGNTHPAVNFLLLLAVADDAIGLGIIAVFYPDPHHLPAPEWLLYLTVPAMLIAFGMRKFGVKQWFPYILIPGVLSWLGFIEAALHPALALVPIVPFLPGPTHDTGLFAEEDEVDEEIAAHKAHPDEPHEHHEHSALHNFEHNLKLPVDIGLFFFAFANAGVPFSSMNAVTWIVLGSLLVGKVIGIVTFSAIGNMLGAKLPDGMGLKHLFVASIIAGLGLTVALFVAGEAFPDGSPFQGPAKMGAVFSAGAALLAIVAGRILGVKDQEA